LQRREDSPIFARRQGPKNNLGIIVNMKINPLAVCDPHRYVSVTEELILLAILTAFLFLRVGISLSVIARIVPVIIGVQERIQSGFEKGTEYIPGPVYEKLVDTVGVQGFSIFFEEDFGKFLITFASMMTIALMMALSITFVTDTIMMKQKFWRPFAKKRILVIYGFICILIAFLLVGIYLVAVYALFFVCHAMFNLLFRPSVWTDDLLSLQSFLRLAFAPCDSSFVFIVLYMLLFFAISATIYNVFYVQQDVFGDKNQEGLTGNHLRNSLRFGRSLCSLSLLIMVPVL
jgi:hypothetical protein